MLTGALFVKFSGDFLDSLLPLPSTLTGGPPCVVRSFFNKMAIGHGVHSKGGTL